MIRLSKEDIARLAQLEPTLRNCVRRGDCELAEATATKIIRILQPLGQTARILQSKNWLYECALEAGHVEHAISGFISVRKRASRGTRIHIEATALLGICYIRKKQFPEAKTFIKEAIDSHKRIPSVKRRQQFHRRLLERVEQECILSGLTGLSADKLDVSSVHEHAVVLLRTKSDDEIEEIIGRALPGESILALRDIRQFAILQMPTSEQKLLMPAKDVEKPREIGKKAKTALKRVAWRSLCSPTSDIYKIWSSALSVAYDKKVIATAIVAALGSWNIGSAALAAALSAITMKFTAEWFCEAYAPDSLMISRTDKN